MNPARLPNPRRGEAPYLFADDIRCPKRLRQVLKTLRRWRLDGQYSVHETRLHPAQVRELAVELLDLVEQDVDALLVGRLSQRGHAPVYQWYPPRNKNVPRVGYRPASIPAHLHDGNYLIAYDDGYISLPLADGFIAHQDAALRQDFLYLAKAQREAMV